MPRIAKVEAKPKLHRAKSGVQVTEMVGNNNYNVIT